MYVTHLFADGEDPDFPVMWGASFSPNNNTVQDEFDYDSLHLMSVCWVSRSVSIIRCVSLCFQPSITCSSPGQHLSQPLPMLALLLDYLSGISKIGPSAAQAPQLRSELTDDQLDMVDGFWSRGEFEPYDEFDQWKDIPDLFTIRWASPSFCAGFVVA